MDWEAIIASPSAWNGVGFAGEMDAQAAGSVEMKLLISEQYTLQRGAIAALSGSLLVYRHATRFNAEVVRMLAADARGRARISLALLGVQPQQPIAKACCAAAELVELAASRIMVSLQAGGGGLVTAETALAPLRRAYETLAAVASERSGCTMIAFENCCCCASPFGIRRAE